MTEPRHLAVVDDYSGLIAVVRGRVEALNVPVDPLEEYMGLTRGHLGKILGLAETKRIGLFTLWKMFEALGLKMVIAEHLDLPATIEEMGEKYRPSAPQARRGRMRKRMSPAVIAASAREMGHKGGSMPKRFRMSPKQRSRLARRAVKARWNKRKSTLPLGRN